MAQYANNHFCGDALKFNCYVTNLSHVTNFNCVQYRCSRVHANMYTANFKSKSNTCHVPNTDTISSLADTTVNALFGHFDIFTQTESSLHHASNDALIFVVFYVINTLILNKVQKS